MTSRGTQPGNEATQSHREVEVPQHLRGAGVIAEDGWIFVERPGVGVKCVRRYDTAQGEISPIAGLVRNAPPRR
jgi:hypothetical protein